MVIYPAIDIRGGRCVRLTQGDYGRETLYDMSPESVAERFARHGAEWIHVVDLDGAREGRPVNGEIVARLVAHAGVKVQVGGGVRTREAALSLLEVGAARVVVGSKLIEDEAFAGALFEELGDQVVAGIDTKNGLAMLHGWTDAGAVTGLELGQRMVALGCRRVIFTDVGRDGVLGGPNLPAVRAMIEGLGVPVIASGGVAALPDLTALAALGAEGAIVGKALYEGRFTLAECLALFADPV